MNKDITLALPSKGAIAEPTYNFLRECGLKIVKPNPRQYTGIMPAIPSMGLLFQRVKDVVYKVADGTADLGISGLDVVYENPSDNVIIIDPALDYGHCKLVIAVPESWVDVENLNDLADVAIEFRENKGRNLRIATTFTHQTREFLHANQIHYFNLVKADGAIEAAPTIGYADIIVDLTQTGTTLRENHLKQIEGGTIANSQACLIGHKDALLTKPHVLRAVKSMCEYFDAARQGKAYVQLSVDMAANTAEELGELLTANPLTHGLIGPTIAEIYGASKTPSNSDKWFTVTLTIPNNNIETTVNFLRESGGTHVLVSPVRYAFFQQSATYTRLLDQLENMRSSTNT